MASIEAPNYSVAVMTADGEDRRSIQITSKNLDRLYLRAYPYDLQRAVTSARDYELLPGHREVPEIMAGDRAGGRVDRRAAADPGLPQPPELLGAAGLDPRRLPHRRIVA